ncbi:hypothetical protein FFF34_002410 [Inquilinus sp. KBS0705]|nr:hypothetical protein FFF34_002410 [Inquilinus sp. KBS0705]
MHKKISFVFFLFLVINYLIPNIGVAQVTSPVTNTNVIKASATTTTALPAPKIAYPAGTKTYTAETAIPALSVTNTGGAIPNAFYGKTTVFAGEGGQGVTDGSGKTAKFGFAMGYAITKGNYIYVADSYYNNIRMISPSGYVSTVAGSGQRGYADGTGKKAIFANPSDVVVDAAGNLFVSDQSNFRIRKITRDGVVTTFAGSGKSASVDGKVTAASFLSPTNMAIDSKGTLYVADQYNGAKVRKITTAGVVTTLASGFDVIRDIATDKAGNVIIIGYTYASVPHEYIIKISPTGVQGYLIAFNGATYLTLDANDNIFVQAYGKLTKISNNATVLTPIPSPPLLGAGLCIDSNGMIFTGNGVAQISKISPLGYTVSPALPPGLIIDGTGNISGTPATSRPAAKYVVTAYNSSGNSSYTLNIAVKGAIQAPAISYASTVLTYTVKRAIAPLKPVNSGGAVPMGTYGKVTSFAGPSDGSHGTNDGKGTDAQFFNPMGLATDYEGNVYVADQENNRIRKINTEGVVRTIAGNGSYNGADGTGAAASFYHPSALAVDDMGNIFVSDQGANKIRKITPTGVVTTFAGGTYNTAPTGNGTNVTIIQPNGMAIDWQNNLYFTSNNRVSKITPNADVTLFAGGYDWGSADGTGSGAKFLYPFGVAVDSKRNVYVADQHNHLIRKISPTGVVTTLAGSGTEGFANGTGKAAKFRNPYALTVDGTGNVYVADYDNNQIRSITPDGVVKTLAGNLTAGRWNETGDKANFNHPSGVVLDGKGNLYEADFYNNEIRKIDVTGYTISPALPAGLVFDGKTGIISGTPTVANAATLYTIVGYNGAGSSLTKIKVAVVQPAGTVHSVPVQQSLAAASPAKTDTSPLSLQQSLSPNGDGINDALVIEGIEKFPDNKLTILNANGTKIFETVKYDNLNKVYKGQSNTNGAKQQAGTYYYQLDYKDGSELKHKTGYIVIKY